MTFSPDQGQTYEFTLSDGRKIRLRFEGLGEYMRPVWRDVDTGEELNRLPPYIPPPVPI